MRAKTRSHLYPFRTLLGLCCGEAGVSSAGLPHGCLEPHAPRSRTNGTLQMNAMRLGILHGFVCLFLVAAPNASRAFDTFIAFNDFWLYRDNGVDPGTAWRNAGL